jgi:AraC-like DNA-binding protein
MISQIPSFLKRRSFAKIIMGEHTAFSWFLLLFFLVLGSSNSSYSQNSDEIRLFREAEGIQYSDPNKSLKLYDFLLKNSRGKETIAIEIKRLAINRFLGNYTEAVEISKHIEEGLKDLSDPSLKFEFYNQLSALYFDLDLIPEGRNVLKKAINLYSQLSAEVQNEYAIDLELTKMKSRGNENSELRIKELIDVLNLLKNDDERKPWLEFQLGELFYLQHSDSAELYFNRVLEVDSSSTIYKSAKIYHHLISENSLDSLPYSNPTLNFLNKNLQETLFRNQLEIWEEKRNPDSLIKYQDLLNTLKHEEKFEVRRAKVLLLQDIYSRKKSDAQAKIDSDKRKTWIGVGILCLLLLIYLVFKLYNKNKKAAALDEETSKSIIISDRTEFEILEKLKRFENSELFLDTQLRLADLAKKLDTNTRYLSTIINSSKDKSFNSYINTLRIQYILHKLDTDPKYLTYKISYLADESGFASQSSFSTAFKEVAGMPPSMYIKKKTSNNS